MTAAKCRRCQRYWSFTVNPDKFDAITKWCPDCIAKILPIAGAAR